MFKEIKNNNTRPEKEYTIVYSNAINKKRVYRYITFQKYINQSLNEQEINIILANEISYHWRNIVCYSHCKLFILKYSFI